ncbi:hypothetical protein CEXT_66081 [Caerostris extrusa]|uniref:Uncharacterized protein n=1 Tax=Caerostris extrusa TaxID=172846 RepID=A0AAV4M9L8_CAEEX|nr:hypothetical protein CEXT_66081 [Caerostris extrusa]
MSQALAANCRHRFEARFVEMMLMQRHSVGIIVDLLQNDCLAKFEVKVKDEQVAHLAQYALHGSEMPYNLLYDYKLKPC